MHSLSKMAISCYFCISAKISPTSLPACMSANGPNLSAGHLYRLLCQFCLACQRVCMSRALLVSNCIVIIADASGHR